MATLLFAFARGGAPERLGTSIIALGTALTYAVQSPFAERFQNIESGTVVVDVAVFVALTTLTLHADRFWPIYATGLQGAAITMHFFKLAVPREFVFGYAVGLAIWSYLILIMIAMAVRRHQRRAVANASDPSWSRSYELVTPIAPDRGPTN